MVIEAMWKPGTISEHLSEIYEPFREKLARITDTEGPLAIAVSEAGGLAERTLRLVKLGIAIGALAEGSVRSHARPALAE